MATTSLDQGHTIELTFGYASAHTTNASRNENVGFLGQYKITIPKCLAVFIGTKGGDASPDYHQLNEPTFDITCVQDSTTTENDKIIHTSSYKYWNNPQGETSRYEQSPTLIDASDIPSRFITFYGDIASIIGTRTIGVSEIGIRGEFSSTGSMYVQNIGDTTSNNGAYCAIAISGTTGTDIYFTEGAMKLLLPDAPYSTNTNVFNPVSQDYGAGSQNVIDITLPSSDLALVTSDPFSSSEEEFHFSLNLISHTNYLGIDGAYQYLSNFASDGSGTIGTNPFVDYSDEDTRYKADWTLNIDGIKNPTLAIHSLSPMIENNTNPNFTAGGTLMHLYAGKETYDIVADLGYYAYGTSAVYSWKEIGEKVGVNGIDKIASLIDSELGQISIIGVLEYEDGTQSSAVGAKVTYKGENTGTSVHQPSDGSTISVKYGKTEDSYTDYDDDIDSVDDGNPLGGTGLLTQTYILGSAQLKQLGEFLWSNDFLENFLPLSGNALDNIISVKVYPYKLVGSGSEEIYLGNLGTGVNGSPIGYNYNSEKNIGSITIPKKYNSFLDYAPYTSVGIFLPYIGFQSLDAEEVIGHTLSVKYFIDIVTGQCMACIYTDGIPIATYTGQIGLDVPVMATNRAQIEAGLISGALSTGLNVGSNMLTGNTIGAMGSLITGGVNLGMEAASSKYKVSTVGSASPACFNYMTHEVFVVIDRPVVQYPSNYNHTYGKPCNLTKTLGSLHGFTMVDNVDLSGITCSNSEKEMIRNYLRGGVIL